MLLGKDDRFVRVAFGSEEEIEGVVFENAELLFGPYAVVLPKQRISTMGGAGTVPDGIVIDLQDRQWYIVEVERAAHGTWEHIAPQVSRQLAAVGREETRDEILRLALDQVKGSSALQDALTELEIEQLSLHGEVTRILKKLPVIAIPIDEVPDDLEDWVRTLKNLVKIWVIEKYTRVGGNDILYSIPDEAILGPGRPSVESPGPQPRSSRGELLRKVIKAELLREGEEVFMTWGPKGKHKQKFSAIVRADGLEVDGKVYSPSYAAVVCMRKGGSSRENANGWMVWRNGAGILFNDLYQQVTEKG